MTDKEKIAAVLDAFDNLKFEGGKTLKTHDKRRFVFDDNGELVRIQELNGKGLWETAGAA